MTADHLPRPSRPARPGPASERLRRRATGLHRVRGVTRWTLFGSAAAALVLGLGYAHALPDVAALLPTHLDGGTGHGTNGTGGGGVQAPSLPGLGGRGSHTTTGGS
jgi:hypothetical protein